MPTITFTIDDTKIKRVRDALKGLYEIPENNEGTPLFTDNQWAKEAVRRLIVRDVARWEQKEAQDAARAEFKPDDTLVT